jgi:hypothetical protein
LVFAIKLFFLRNLTAPIGGLVETKGLVFALKMFFLRNRKAPIGGLVETRGFGSARFQGWKPAPVETKGMVCAVSELETRAPV